MPATLLRILSAAAVETPDAELLGRFIAHRDDAAFAELVQRHGPAVWRVCRRLVGSTSADDAFQATFLILACRADSVRKAASLGSWLVGVAGRVSRQLRKAERRAAGVDPRILDGVPAAEQLPAFDELAAILDDELTRLPDHLRDPVVLCLLNGRTQEEAAAELGGSVRTLRRRLDRAKNVLQLRLERRGIVPALAAGLIAGLNAPATALPPELLQSTLRGVFSFLSGGAVTPAAILAKGIVMGTAKLKVGGLIAAAAMVMIGLGIGFADDPTKPPAAEQPLAPAEKKSDKRIAAAAPGESPKGVYRSTNFLVTAPTPTQARMIAMEAEHQRREVAKRWLGNELPTWPNRCTILFTTDERPREATTFTFGNAMQSASMELTGSFQWAAEGFLPRQVAHCVMATLFGKPVPRWADEGIAQLSGPAPVDTPAREMMGLPTVESHIYRLLNGGRAIRLKHLFKMSEYPKDTEVLPAQGLSVVKFLLTREAKFVPGGVQKDGEAPRPAPGLGILVATPRVPEAALIDFVKIGADGNTVESWDKAAKLMYGFDSVDALETAWIEWLKKPESKLDAKPPVLPPAKDDKPELIPPTKLPEK